MPAIQYQYILHKKMQFWQIKWFMKWGLNGVTGDSRKFLGGCKGVTGKLQKISGGS